MEIDLNDSINNQKHIVNEDSIEHIYKAYNNLKQTYDIWKNIYKAVDGKIVKQKTVYGTFIPPQKESYKFD